MNKLISVIIPVKNGGKYIKYTLEAIKKQKMNLEIIVLNDGSTDNTVEIAQKYDCKIISHEKSFGPVVAKNTALKVAKGAYIMFHDADDVMNDGALNKLYNELESDSEISAVMAKVKDFISPELSKEEKQKTIIKKEAYYGLFTGAVLIRKSVFDKIGLFDENVTAGEIIAWNLKMKEHNLKIEKIDFTSTNRRIHSTNFGKVDSKKEFKDYAKILRAKLQGSKDTMTQIVNKFRSSSFIKDRMKLTDNEHQLNVGNLMKNLDKDAYLHCQNLVEKLEKAYAKPMVSIEDIYSKNELEELEKVKYFEKEIIFQNGNYSWKDFILPLKLFESSVFYFKHGVDFLKTKDTVKDKTIIDAGCFIADSALVFRKEFKDAYICGFEPTKSNYNLALKTVELNNIKNIKIENLGLGDIEEVNKIKTYETDLKNIESTICDDGNEEIKITTIDAYVEKNSLKVGLIKTDVEGFEQKLLQGAKKTICKQKPILLISIYHNYDDFYKIKPMIESWNLGYRFDFFQGVQNSGDIIVETLLICEVL